MAPQPLHVRVDKSRRVLTLVWADQSSNEYPWSFLRSHCPSAGEKVAREQADPLAILKRIPSSELVDVRMVGAYALGLTWADGHNAGIYTWDYFRELASLLQT